MTKHDAASLFAPIGGESYRFLAHFAGLFDVWRAAAPGPGQHQHVAASAPSTARRP